ncbi:hypothetical protein IC757_01150 [Wenzhouxiangella sp. AB-CW3]|uniref:alpha-2-macroglobulin family protein n=1 Tax=Wenzhouxiangella sp. AB-CW3 TaxID=2771012 RepID=UPI00168BB1E1|nr:alpha-2-macroglobulin family protein [Wenzhouxiangella sp. AB-CW3]QOC22802.1 hypothetical protein IC757_01150 [Wenzhouxiangella sp. AB-CW3]
MTRFSIQRMQRLGLLLPLLALTCLPLPAPAAGDSSAVLVPDTFVRPWDPVTVFFDEPQDVEPGLVLSPPESVGFSPAHPGVFQWLDRQTLQFRPADRWPALARFEWQVDGQRIPLHTLMRPAQSSRPRDGADDLAPIKTVELSFPDPVPLETLADMLSLEVHALPAVDSEPTRLLDATDFSLQQLERSGPQRPVSYRIRLDEPVAEGHELRVQLRLSAAEDDQRAFQTLRFRTRTPFRALSLGCGNAQRSVTREGSDYPGDDALLCHGDNRVLDLHLSDAPAAIDPVLGRNLLRVEPAVDNLSWRVAGSRIRLSGDFQPDVLYRLSVHPAGLEDRHGRTLDLHGVTSVALRFPGPDPFLRIGRGQGRLMMETFGPRMLPLRGRGHAQVDLRIHPIDAEDLRYWPFTDAPVRIDENRRPPGPGEEPGARRGSGPQSLRMGSEELARRILLLGSPPVSTIEPLPLDLDGPSARFGLDLAPWLEQLAGAEQPGHYLVGVRRMDGSDDRHWLRLQVTDLSLTVIEEEEHVRFVVTSLETGEPIDGAQVQIEAPPRRQDNSRDLLVTLDRGDTDADGAWRWRPRPRSGSHRPARIVVRHGDDRLVLDVNGDPPERFFDGHMSPAGNWLDWTASRRSIERRGEQAEWHCHLFTERPVYRPEEGMHIAGFARQVHRGQILQTDQTVHLLLRGPDGSEWRHRTELDEAGGFYWHFDETTEATGDYRLSARLGGRGSDDLCGPVTVERTPYRLPRFEVRLDGPDRVGLDAPFELVLDAEYYAGGTVRDRPVRWQITPFPYRWQPRGREGFLFSTDARYASMGELSTDAAGSRPGRTDETGRARLEIDPTLEDSAQPRRYVVEATVTGDDDQTVTDTHDVLALPPFLLGLNTPRYLQQADELDVEVLVAGPDENLLAGHEIELRLIRRRWAARLRASDFSDGQPRYSTEQVDEVVAERSLVSDDEPLAVSLPLADTGVYLVELTARDALGRAQSISVDLFNDGEARATWSKPPSETFELVSAEESYRPGETARLVLQSPLEQARALVIVEQPDGGNDYHWMNVSGGRAVFELPIEREHLPSVPVHVLLKRGRLDEDDFAASRKAGMDLGKPVMMAASTRIEINNAAHRVYLDIDHPAEARPGEEVDLKLTLRDENDQPLAGHVSLWLVDQAVLALGEEQRLDMLPDFLRERRVRTALRDTRNRPVGYLPFLTEPGGDGALERMRTGMADEILAGLTIRERFESVPFFEHAIAVGATGQAVVPITLPDDLTNFLLRAKAVAGVDRFGHERGRIAVRLPVIVQPSLPRFVRYGDEATLSATSRVLDDNGGSAVAALQLSGLDSLGETSRPFEWSESGSKRLDFPVYVPLPEDHSSEQLETPRARVTIGVERDSDGVGDAFAVDLPVLPDRRALNDRLLLPFDDDQRAHELPGPAEPVRTGSLERSLLLSPRSGSLQVSAALNQLLTYPHAGAEQRISRARGLLAARALIELLYPQSGTELIDHHVASTLDYLVDVQRSDGSIGLWPQSSRSHVPVTSWALHLVVEAEAQDFEIPASLRNGLHRALRASLRGRNSYFYSRYTERTMALTALAADDELDAGYAAELARRRQFLSLEAMAEVTLALASGSSPGAVLLGQLADSLHAGLIFQLRDGEPVYTGLRQGPSPASPMILPSETRVIARMLRALREVPEQGRREQTLVDVLLRLGDENGWGHSNANAEAIMALVGEMQRPLEADEYLDWQLDDDTLSVDTPLLRHAISGEQDHHLRLDQGQGAAMQQMIYVPEPPGSHAEAQARGLVLERTLVRIDPEHEQPEREQHLEEAGQDIDWSVGEVIEQRLTVISPLQRHHVAISLPLAAGMELLNPSLDTAPPESTPSRPDSLEPDFVAWRDHEVVYYFDQLPAGSHHFAFRARAQFPGRYSLPPAHAELMYQPDVRGHSHGATVRIARPGSD